MQTISVKSSGSKKIIPLLADAIEREKRIIQHSLSATRQKVDTLAKNLSVDVNKLMRGEVEHPDPADMELLELEGEIEILRHLEIELKEIESIEICG